MCTNTVFKALVQVQLLQAKKMRKEGEQSEEVSSQYCKYHNDCTGQTIQECVEFREIVQDFIDKKEMEFSEKLEEKSINVITSATYSENPS